MAKRKRKIAITIWSDYMDVWCDLNLKERIKNGELLNENLSAVLRGC